MLLNFTCYVDNKESWFTGSSQILASSVGTTDLILRPRSFDNRKQLQKSDLEQINPAFNTSTSIGVNVLGLLLIDIRWYTPRRTHQEQIFDYLEFGKRYGYEWLKTKIRNLESVQLNVKYESWTPEGRMNGRLIKNLFQVLN